MTREDRLSDYIKQLREAARGPVEDARLVVEAGAEKAMRAEFETGSLERILERPAN